MRVRVEVGISRRLLTCAAAFAAVAPSCLAQDAAPSASSAQDHFFQTSDGVRLHYLERGPADGRTLLFVPGWRMPAFIWTRQIETFSAGWRVIALDPRGQGQSQVAADGYEPVRRGRDIAELIDHLGVDKVVLVGWSLGVLDALAMIAAGGAPRVAGLVLVDNSVGEGPAPTRPPASVAKAGRARPTCDEALMRQFVAGLFVTAQDAAFIQALTQATLITPKWAADRLRRYDVPRVFWKTTLYATQMPVLYVVRPRWRAQAESVVRNHPQAETSVFEGAGHALFVDEPERFNALVLDFLHRRVWP